MSTDFKPAEFVQTMINVGEAKTNTSTRDLLLRGTMAGVILSLAWWLLLPRLYKRVSVL